MYLERLFLMNYRNVEQADLQFSPKMNCLTGLNGMGKTNIMDAIHFLSFCKSSLAQTEAQIVRHGSECMMLNGRYQAEGGDVTSISCSLKAQGRKQFLRDNKEYRKFSDHIGLIPLVMVSPADSRLILGGSEERRRFLDMVISQYDNEYLGHLIDYNKAMAQRNALLKSDSNDGSGQFDIWEDMMDCHASFIYNRRKEFTAGLVPVFQRLYSGIGATDEEVGLSYTSHCSGGRLSDMLRQSRPKERILGYSIHGIHKDELEMTLCGYSLRREGSQGQGKSYIVALRLAQYLYLAGACNGRKPIMLLDDLFDKLDPQRVERILKLLAGDDFGQIFITDVYEEHLTMLLQSMSYDFKIFRIKDGEAL